MLNYVEIIKNTAAYKMIELDTQSSRLSHAYFFVSKDNSYLKCFLEEACKLFINLNESVNAEKNCIRIEKRVHPDVKFFGEDKQISAAVANEIVDLANYSPFEADKKIFVLWDVSGMNEASQNKILKTIEEPPRDTYFFLASNGITRILPTILSRVKMIELDELKTETISNLLQAAGVEKNKAEICASCSNGNAEFAENLATNEGFVDFFNQIVSCYFDINGSRDVLKYSTYFNSKNIDKYEFFDIATLVARDLALILAKKPEMVVCKNAINKLKVISGMLNLSAVTTLIEECVKCKEKLHFNVNGTAVIDGFLFKLAEVKVKCRRL